MMPAIGESAPTAAVVSVLRTVGPTPENRLGGRVMDLIPPPILEKTYSMPSSEMGMVFSSAGGAVATTGAGVAAAAAAGVPAAACTTSGPVVIRGCGLGNVQNQAMRPAVQRVTTIQAVRSMWKNEDGNEGGSKKRGRGGATRSQSDQERCVEKQIREKQMGVQRSCP